jgi:hypothetical protein
MSCGAAVVLAACAGQTGSSAGETHFVQTWKDPGSEPQVFQPGDNVVALVLGLDASTQQAVELALVVELSRHGVSALPGHALITAEEALAPELALPRLKERGAAAVVLVRTLGVHTEGRDRQPVFVGPAVGLGSVRGGFGPYYLHGRGPAGPNDAADRTVRVETLLFDLKRDALLWAGKSETSGSRALPSLMGDLLNAVGAEMARQGVIPPLKS